MKKITSLVIILLITLTTYAVPARPGWQTKVQPDGTNIQLRLMGDEFHHYWADADGNIVKQDTNGYWRVVESQPSAATIKARRQASHMLQSRPKRAIGVRNFAPRGLVILVNFKDKSFKSANNQAAMNELMNSDNYTYNGATGSVRKYFSDQSNGQYTPEFDVVGPVTLPDYMSHYGGNDSDDNDKLPGDMVVEACSIANANHKVDFTQYDNDGDDYVDFVYLIYAGKGEADGGAANTIWPHNWDLESAYYYDNCTYDESARRFDGKYINNYACSGEISSIYNEWGEIINDARTGIGTIAHEFGHVIGLPDVYDIDYGQNYEDYMTPGEWHIMDGGSYNNNGNTPPNYSIYDKYYLGWQTPVNPGSQAQNLSLIAAGEKGFNSYQIASSNSLLSATSTNTIYYIENRQQTGWDAGLPGHGLIIWKIQYDESAWEANGPNDQDGKVRYAIVSATGKTTDIGTDADPFPGTKNKTSWNGLSGKPLLNITEKNGVISLSYIEIPDENNWKYEVLYEHATVSSESGKVAKGGTLTLTVKPAVGYLLDETMIEVEENDEARNFTYTGTTLTINNVQGDLSIYIMPEEDPNYVPVQYTVTWMTNGNQFEQATYNEGDKLVLPTDSPEACTVGKTFMGWTNAADYTHESIAPTYVTAGTQVTADATYHAVFATIQEGTQQQETVTKETFTSITDELDEYISYEAEQGTGTSVPQVINDVLRIYQKGGILNVYAKEDATITSLTIGSGMKTTITYQIDGGTTSKSVNMAANTKHTLLDINANHVKYTCIGTDKSSRLYLNYLSVTYTTGTATTYSDYSTICIGDPGNPPIGNALDNTTIDASPTKVLHNGQLLIHRNGKTYTVMGQEL